MRLPEFCIKRPVFTTVMSLILMVVGIIGYFRLSLRELPNISPPVVSVYTNYTGASPKLVESQITTPIEQALSSVNGIKYMRSSSNQGSSDVVIYFKLGVDVNEAVNDVRNKLAWVTNDLPQGVKAPIVSRSDPNATDILILTLTDPNKSPLEITDYLKRYIQPKIEQINGVANVNLFGAREYAMHVWLDPWKMAMRHVTAQDVVSAVQEQNANMPSGQIKSDARYYNVFTQAQVHTAEKFNDLVIREQNDYPVKLQDIGVAKLSAASDEGAMRVSGKKAVGFGIIAQTNANPVAVAAQVKEAVAKIKQTLPQDMQLSIMYDTTDYIHASLKNVVKSVFEAVLLVLLVVFLFLGTLRATTIPIITIPICLVAVFGFIYMLGYSINVITLLAMVLAIGLVVDDAIVMLENIYRHVESGLSRWQAALKGSREIIFAIIAMTITLAAVYAPIGFSQGFTGVIFRQFAFTLAIAVIISGFVALTLSPMMCARMLPKSDQTNRFAKRFNSAFDCFAKYYRRILTMVLNKRAWVVGLLVLMIAGGYWVFKTMPSALAPTEDIGAFMVSLNAPSSASFEYTDRYAKQVEEIFQALPDLKTYIMISGFNNPAHAFSWVILHSWNQRNISQDQIVSEISSKLDNIAGIDAYARSPSPLGMHNHHGGALSFALMSTSNYQDLNKVANRFKAIMEKNPGLVSPEVDLQVNNTQFDVSINRALAATLQVNLASIANTLSVMLGGNTVNTFQVGDQGYDVIVQMRRNDRKNLDAVNYLYVRSNTGKMIPLSSLVTIQEEIGPTSLPHYDRMRSTTLYAQLKPGYTMGEAIHFVEQASKQILPEGFKYRFTGTANRMLESNSTMLQAFLLALIFIYLVLAAQFESFIDPLIILFSVPLSIVGAIITLRLTGNGLSLYSSIGFVTLIGLVAKHGILITEFANQLRRQGTELSEAIVESACLRLRPILMTTAAMALGALPLALAHGAGAFSRQQIGWVIVGGLSVGTFFSLFVVPVAYSFLGRLHKWQPESEQESAVSEHS